MLNKVELIGRLGRDPEVKYMQNGEAVCNFSIATTETWKDRNGEKQTSTEWHNITMYRKTAEIAGKYLKKGSLVRLEGKIKSRKYTDKNSVERVAYDIICDQMLMLGGNDGSQSSHQEAATTQAPPPPPVRQQAPSNPPTLAENSDDVIPF